MEGNLIFPYPAPVWPGLVGSELDTDTGNSLTYDFGWRAGIDSFFEVRTSALLAYLHANKFSSTS